MRIRTLIVDDEPLARLNLSSLLATEADFEIVGECGDAHAAVTTIAQARPQLVFLDVQMPGMNGFDVLGAAPPSAAPPAVVFVTAHERFAVQAFEAQAVDYLLKPFRRERFQTSLERVRQRLFGGPVLALPLEADRMLVKSGEQLLFIAFAELDYIRAAANYVTLHIGEAAYDTREKIGELETRLPAGRFVRIHRSYIVRLAQLHSLYPVGAGEHMARLRNGRELPVGASFVASIRQALMLAGIPRLGGSGGI